MNSPAHSLFLSDKRQPVACRKAAVMGENSGMIRDALLAVGVDAISCDLLDSDRPGPHYRGDMFDIIDYPWDLAIFHIPCTNTSVSGAKHFAAKWADGRQAASVSMFMRAWKGAAHIPRVAFEHPVSIMSRLPSRGNSDMERSRQRAGGCAACPS